jgi:hypothetical protein
VGYEDLLEQLELQRRREWTDYGAAVWTAIQTAVAAIEGLTVPVDIRIDIDTYRPGLSLDDEWDDTAAQLARMAADSPLHPDHPAAGSRIGR